MTELLFDIGPRPCLPILGEDRAYAVRRVFCVGRNYAAHAREMGMAAPEDPFFFMKPADALVPGGGTIPYPSATQDLHHEVELAVALGPDAQPVAEAVAIDLTRRDLQAALRDKGRPWDIAKGFDRAAPIGPLHRIDGAARAQGAIWLRVNGRERQRGDLAEMIRPVPDILAALSALFELGAGDVILTGTPSGVGKLRPGDRIEAGIDGLPDLHVQIAD